MSTDFLSYDGESEDIASGAVDLDTRDPESGKIRVLAEKCSTCVLRPGNQMDLRAGRLKNLIEDNINFGGGLVCHKTLPYGERLAQPAICRGFFDAFGDRCGGLRVLLRICGGTHDVVLPDPEEKA